MSDLQKIRARLDELRKLYLNATPAQRYKVALDRLRDRESRVNQLTQQVGAVEGFARSVAVDVQCKNGVPLNEAYETLRYLNGIRLLAEHIAPAQESTAPEIFGSEDWELFTLAVEARNFLVHEAAYLRGGDCEQLGASCERVLQRLAAMAGVSV